MWLQRGSAVIYCLEPERREGDDRYASVGGQRNTNRSISVVHGVDGFSFDRYHRSRVRYVCI
ncbi:hypothetical protein C486_10010 [Natrinema gari JCM 14663]|uniref:Uncharacterized protein n=1 Tax=Natrinema gari JCM 14663 TaxID=1230459 RepID=L9Z0N3_9EURY|nr:hypothetical protein C486_10010 [Natrinema gari JCM 14663]